MRINARNQDKIVVSEISNYRGRCIDEFTYLGAKVCKEGGGMKDLKNRRSSAFVRLKNMWHSKSISRKQS